MKRISAVGLLLVLAATPPARSQFVQYTEPGSAADAPEDPAAEAKKAAENARWRFGRLRLHPSLTLTNVGYVQNLFSAPEGSQQIDDTHATLGAGLAGYVRLGSKSLVTGYIAPEYFWWQDSTELREFSLSSGFGWFGDFNRLQLSATLRDSERQRRLSFEVAAPVTVSEEALAFDASLEMTRRLVLFAAASDQQTQHGNEVERFVEGLSLRSLDRDTQRQIAGIELRRSNFELGLGFEWTETNLLESNLRDSTGEGPLLRLRYQRDRLSIRAGYSQLELDFEDPALSDRSQMIGSASLAFSFRPKTTATVYFTDHLAFTTLSTEGIIEAQGRGLAIKQGFGSRLEASVFAETRDQVFTDPQNPGRKDDLEAFGVSLVFDLRDKLTLSATLSDAMQNSTEVGLDYSYSTFALGLGFASDLLPW